MYDRDYVKISVTLIIFSFFTIFFLAQNQVFAYNEYDTIEINGNEEFTPENGVIMGNGTFNNPYIIQGWHINGLSYGIEIRNTDAFFIIREVHISQCGRGILLFDVINGQIQNSIIIENRYGIRIYECSNISLFTTSIINNLIGISVDFSENVFITQNEILESKSVGIELISSGNCLVYHNDFIENNDHAYDLHGSQNYWNLSYPFEGNYWSDYEGIDNNNDNIGDTPHTFTGNQDNYPLMKPYNISNEPWLLIGIIIAIIALIIAAISLVYYMRKKKP